MTRTRHISQPDEVLRAWGTQPIPVEFEGTGAERRAVVIDAISREMRASLRRHDRRTYFQRISTFALAATMLLGIGAAWRLGVSQGQSAHHAEISAEVAAIHGRAVLVRNGHMESNPPATGHALARGEELRTLEDGRAELRTHKSRVLLGPESAIAMAPMPGTHEERLNLSRGHVDVSVDKHVEPWRSVVVETPNAEVVVRGTVFAVDVQGGQQQAMTAVKVSRGTVWVFVKGQRVAELNAGQEWTSANEAKSASVPTASQPQPAVVETNTDEAIPETPKRKPAPAAKGEQKVTPPVSGTLAEENRLFQSALDARNRHDDAHAIQLFDELLTRFNRSALGEEAQVERFRALKRLGRTEAAQAAARRYLASYRSGFAREEAKVIALPVD